MGEGNAPGLMDRLTASISREVAQHIHDESEKSIKAAVKAFEVDLRAAVGSAAVRIARHVDMRADGDRLVITVRTPKGSD